jgi:hypothetical protein
MRKWSGGWYRRTRQLSAVREYASKRAMQRDIRRASKHGWRVVGVSELTQRPGCIRGCTLGLFALVFRPASHLLATYQRDADDRDE